MMLDEIDQAARRLTPGGAHLVITTMPPPAPNELCRQYGRAHPDTVSVIDFEGAVRPGAAPCARSNSRERGATRPASSIARP
jgi:hypothetical protein